MGREVLSTTMWIFNDAVIHGSSGIAALFVIYDLLTPLDICLWSCIKKSHRRETKSRNIVDDAAVVWNSHESAWQVIWADLKLVHWYTTSAGFHLEHQAACHVMSQLD